MTLMKKHMRPQLSGTIYVKMRGVVIKQVVFHERKTCKYWVRQFCKEYPDFDVSVIFNDND